MDTTERAQTHPAYSFIFLSLSCHFCTFHHQVIFHPFLLAGIEANDRVWTHSSALLPFTDHLLLLDVPPQLSRPSAAPGSALETFVGEDVNTMLIVNLLSGTEYSVKVIASYTTGSSEALSGRAKTCKFILCFSNLMSQLRSGAVCLKEFCRLYRKMNSFHLCWSHTAVEQRQNTNSNLNTKSCSTDSTETYFSVK